MSGAQTTPAAAPTQEPAPATEAAPGPTVLSMVRKAGDSELLMRELADAALQLTAVDEPFLALWQPDTSGTPKGAVLMLHAQGDTPNGRASFTGIRRQLPEHGWATLSIALPEPTPEPAAESRETEQTATPPSAQAHNPEQKAVQRIAAGLSFLQQQGQTPLVILGEGLGAARAMDYVQRQGQGNVKAVVLLDARNRIPGHSFELPSSLNAGQLPVLDLYTGSHHLDEKEASERQTAARAQGHESYRQLFLGPQRSVSAGPTAAQRLVRGYLRSLFENE